MRLPKSIPHPRRCLRERHALPWFSRCVEMMGLRRLSLKVAQQQHLRTTELCATRCLSAPPRTRTKKCRAEKMTAVEKRGGGGGDHSRGTSTGGCLCIFLIGVVVVAPAAVFSSSSSSSCSSQPSLHCSDFNVVQLRLMERRPGAKMSLAELASHTHHGVDNTGNVRVWPAEQVLLHVVLQALQKRHSQRKPSTMTTTRAMQSPPAVLSQMILPTRCARARGGCADAVFLSLGGA